jgi:hypothetical protein
MKAAEKIAGELMLAALAEEEAGGEACLCGTIGEIAGRIGSSPSMVSLALRLSRTPEFIEANGYSFPSLGNGRSGAKHCYSLEYHRPSLELAEAQMAQHGQRLLGTLRSLRSQYELASGIADGRTALAKQISLALKAVDLAADSLEMGLREPVPA